MISCSHNTQRTLTLILYLAFTIELIPEHCRFINDGYINPISVLANTMVASFPGSFRKRQPRNEAKTVRYSGSIAVVYHDPSALKCITVHSKDPSALSDIALHYHDRSAHSCNLPTLIAAVPSHAHSRFPVHFLSCIPLHSHTSQCTTMITVH